eukprot:m.208070 g.208070  ORF g.208070 m.208070 type:complete len:339 (+) comp26080_c0_seq2:141-1157(+)
MYGSQTPSLVNGPTDTAQCIDWSPKDYFVCAGSWDCSAKCWQVDQRGNSQLSLENKLQAPIFDCAWHDDGANIFLAGADKAAHVWDLTSNSLTQVAEHEAPIKTCHWASDLQLLMTGGWDGKLAFWDPRSQQAARSFKLPGQIYCADVCGQLAVVAPADKNIYVYTLNNGPEPYNKYASTLHYETRSLACFPAQDGFAVGSIEGRVSIQYVEEAKAKANNFGFRCHRDADGIHAIHSISFHPRFGTFATTGSDGKFFFWDKETRNRLKISSGQGQPIVCSKFSMDGTLFAYSVGNDWSRGHELIETKKPPRINIHVTPDSEIEPRPAQQQTGGFNKRF